MHIKDICEYYYSAWQRMSKHEGWLDWVNNHFEPYKVNQYVKGLSWKNIEDNLGYGILVNNLDMIEVYLVEGGEIIGKDGMKMYGVWNLLTIGGILNDKQIYNIFEELAKNRPIIMTEEE